MVRHRPVYVQRGTSLVSMLVALATGLVVLAAATGPLHDALNQHRREAARQRLQGEVQALLDVFARDARRAGFWSSPNASADNPLPNPYAPISTPTAGDLRYHYTRDEGLDNQVVNTTGPNETFGFRHAASTLQSHVTGAWQTLSDTAAGTVEHFGVGITNVHIDQGAWCQAGGVVRSTLLQGCCRPAPSDPTQCQARVFVRNADGTVEGSGRAPASGEVIHPACPQRVVRHVTGTLRMRAPSPHEDLVVEQQRHVVVRADDHVQGQCP
jgi:prepilin peptidase dependent protein B